MKLIGAEKTETKANVKKKGEKGSTIKNKTEWGEINKKPKHKKG
jgi:hypothetical protein